MKFYDSKKLHKIYNFFVVLFSLTAVILAFLDLGNKINIDMFPYNYIDNSILIIFTIDYFTRFIISKDKKKFFKELFLQSYKAF